MQKIVISGASSGLGLELAKRLSKKYYIICFARNLDKLKKKFSSNKNVEIYKVDLNNFKNLEKFLNKIILKHKNISAIINNAGQMYINDVSKIEIKQMIKVYNVNVFSPIIIMKYMINHMIKNNYGRIVNITSGAPLNCFKEYSIYSSTKASLNSATITASKEINDKNITINLVSPGPIKTNMTSGMKVKFFSMDQAIKDITKLVSKENKINGKFIWRGKIIPIFPNLKGINWLKGKATKNYKKI
jgi:short-subunit dehydrogenase